MVWTLGWSLPHGSSILLYPLLGHRDLVGEPTASACLAVILCSYFTFPYGAAIFPMFMTIIVASSFLIK